MAAPIEVAVCTDSTAQLWSCVVWELHSGANLLTYRGGQAGPRGLTLLNGEYLLAAQLGKNYISAWELQRKVRRRAPGRLRRRGPAGSATPGTGRRAPPGRSAHARAVGVACGRKVLAPLAGWARGGGAPEAAGQALAGLKGRDGEVVGP